MTMSLASQPLDIILLILDVGELGSSDAIALRSVCRSLYHTSEDRSFWLSVANNVQRRHLLPLLPFRQMPSLSAEEIRTACVRHAATSMNLQSPKPQHRGSRIFVPGTEHSSVETLAILHGGRHCLTTHNRGTIGIWDLHSDLGMDVDAASERDALPDTEYSPKPVGTLLASIDTVSDLCILNYRTFGHEEKQVVVTTASRSDEGDCVSSVFEFNFISEYEVTTHQHYQTVTEMPAEISTLGPYGLAVFFIDDSEYGEVPISLLVVDFIRGDSVLIRALGMPPNHWFMYDMTATDAGDLLIYKATNRALEIFAYFDIGGLMGSQSEPITLAPHATETIAYSETCQFPDIGNGFVRHPRDTPSIRTLHQLPVLAEFLSYSSVESCIKWTLGAHYLDSDHLLAHLKSGGWTDLGEPMHRKFHHVEGQISLGEEEVQGSELKAFGDSSRHALWVGEPTVTGANGSRSLYLLPLHSPADDPTPEEGLDLCEGLRTLELPIVLDGVTQLGFCDASGIAMVVKDGTTDGGRYEQRIHFFQY